MLAPTKPVKSCECGSPCGGCCCCTKESIGLGNVDNTSDLNKPLSRDMVDALSGKVDLDVFTQLKNRVLALENSIPDITALENRMTNAESNIVTLQSNYANLSQAISNLTDTVDTLSTRVTGVNDALVTVGTRVDALEIKDSNNVKLSGVNVQAIQGTLKANDPATGATDKTLVTANWVSQTGDSAPNNVAHRNGNETWLGLKTIPMININYLRATTVNTNDNTVILYDMGLSPESNFNLQVCIECIGRGHWRQLYLQIYNTHTAIRAENVIAGGNEGLKVIRRVSDNHIYIGMRTTQNDFPDVQIKYSQYRGTLSPFTKTIINITDNQDYTVEDIPTM